MHKQKVEMPGVDEVALILAYILRPNHKYHLMSTSSNGIQSACIVNNIHALSLCLTKNEWLNKTNCSFKTLLWAYV